jgi:hypothetical protein
VTFDDRVGLPAAERQTLETTLAAQPILQDAVRWALTLSPPRLVAEVIVQDEFTHDVVIPYRDTLHLVYDTT